MTTRAVSLIAGVSERQLQYWDEQRLVHPAHEGHCRIWSERDVRLVGIVRDLRAKEVPVPTIKRLLRNHAQHEAGYLVLVGAGRCRYCRDEAEVLQVAAKARGGVMLVEVGSDAN
jgi:DNA-binding transcriptional MerR regulator